MYAAISTKVHVVTSVKSQDNHLGFLHGKISNYVTNLEKSHL